MTMTFRLGTDMPQTVHTERETRFAEVYAEEIEHDMRQSPDAYGFGEVPPDVTVRARQTALRMTDAWAAGRTSAPSNAAKRAAKRVGALPTKAGIHAWLAGEV